MSGTVALDRDYPAPQPVTRIFRLDGPCEALRDAGDIRAFYHDEARSEAIVEALREIAIAEKIKVLSFDVFDTALLRECKSEAGRFRDISERFIAHCRSQRKPLAYGAEDAFLARVTAARAAYAISPSFAGNREGRFEDIARITCDLLGCPELSAAYVANELEYEAEALTPNPLVERLLNALPGVRAIFVSDMYLEGNRIAGLLAEWLGFDVAGRVHSSADGFGSKRTGGIFPHIEAVLGVTGERILHVGDSFRSDYRIPKRHGWNAFHLPLPAAEIQNRRACHDAVTEHFASAGIAVDQYLQFNP